MGGDSLDLQKKSPLGCTIGWKGIVREKDRWKKWQGGVNSEGREREKRDKGGVGRRETEMEREAQAE